MAMEFLEGAWKEYSAVSTAQEVASLVESTQQQSGLYRPTDDGHHLPERTPQLLAQVSEQQASEYPKLRAPRFQTTPESGHYR